MSQSGQRDAKEESDAFFVMVEKVQSMIREDLEKMSSEELLKLGEPLLDITNHTIKLSDETLQILSRTLSGLAESIRSITREEHSKISREVEQILSADKNITNRNLDTDDVREVLLNINGGVSTMSATCESLFNHWGGYIHLYPGDNLNIANDLCPAGSIFYVYSGTHNNQYVNNSKDGNYWLGAGGVPVLHGQDFRARAFSGGMKNNIIAFLEIRNYTDHGIRSTSSASTNIEISYMTFRNIAGNKSGAVDFGAIHFDYVQNVLVQNSYFNNVSHSVRFRYSDGPLEVLNNEALNTGFGFFQCVECEGQGNIIRINHNSLEHSSQYGLDPLRDFINIFKSKGSSSSNRIQVNNNRARINLINGNASGVSDTGCFIILGDISGIHQEAKNNIGVNPGNCGIGTAGGSLAKVENNKIFSEQIDGISNVGIYAAAFPSHVSCEHPPNTFNNNLSSFICGQSKFYGNETNCGVGSNNHAWAHESENDQGYCEILIGEIRDDDRVKKDLTLTADIWNEW